MLAYNTAPKITKNTSTIANHKNMIEYINLIKLNDFNGNSIKTIYGPFSLNAWEEIEELIFMDQYKNKSKITFTFKCTYPNTDFDIVLYKNVEFKKTGIPWIVTYNPMAIEPRNLNQIIKCLFPNIKKIVQRPKPSLIKLLG